ncbi:DNA-binding response OmpR family regulator [Duganella sp. 1411]|uniref:response regulator transcription factor n=1 Tax=Duganella sp. 1411 TaxID=2806572 RepID=UPI001AE67A54|nr:response regulator transcription factor [Duganella sp. 1411]MBP1202468.1 DNA-binding response OmpR family regulator [Duganella sp. 1411]
MHILLVEDDHKAARLLARGLEEEGFLVVVAHSAEEAAAHAVDRFDMAILDWMMPGKTGVALCAEWRQAGHRLPVLMLTARDAVADRITGLNTGADDYLTKPFVFDELLARVRALLRRTERVRPALLRVADLWLDPATRAAGRAGAGFDLTPKEYAILELLMRRTGDIVSRLQLAEHVWQADLIAIDNLIDVHMKNLRRKVDAPGLPALIETVRGRGFRLAPPEAGDA